MATTRADGLTDRVVERCGVEPEQRDEVRAVVEAMLSMDRRVSRLMGENGLSLRATLDASSLSEEARSTLLRGYCELNLESGLVPLTVALFNVLGRPHATPAEDARDLEKVKLVRHALDLAVDAIFARIVRTAVTLDE